MRELRARGGSERVESESMRISGVIMLTDHRGVLLTLSLASARLLSITDLIESAGRGRRCRKATCLTWLPST